MASPVEALQAAGYSEDEIASWAQERRGTLTTAGFKENEIDAYFTGGVVAPDTIPQAFENRIAAGNEARKREGGLLQTIPQGIAIMSSPEGRAQMWETVKKYPAHFLNSLKEQAEVPGEVARGNIDLSTDEGMDKAIGLGVLVGFGRFSKTPRTGQTSGMSVAMGEQVARIERGPTGEITETPVGGLPNSADFVNAARAVTDESAPRAVQDKLLAAYENEGRHPAEVAHDAQRDPVVAQSLLSKDPLDMPYAHLEGDFGYTFNADEPILPRSLRKVVDEMRTNGFDASSAELFFKDIAQRKVEATDPLLKTDTVEVHELPKLFGDFEIKPMEAPKEQLPPREGSLESAKAEVSEKISVGEQDAQRKLTWRRAYTEAIDDLHPLKAASNDAYQMARLTRGQFGKAEYFLEQGTFDFNTLKDTGKPLREILEPVRDDLSGLREYLAAKRAMEIEESGRKSGIDFLAARQVVAEGRKQYEKIAGDIIDYQRETLKYLKDSGVLSEDAHAAMVEANKNYVPFYRVMGDEVGGPKSGSSLGPGSPIKRLKGSERDMIDPIESIIKNTYAYVSIAERNQAGIAIIDALKKQGEKVEVKRPAKAESELTEYLKDHGVAEPEKIAEFVQNAAATDGTLIRAFRDGVREEVKVNDPDLVAAFQGIDREAANTLVKILAVPARTLRAGATLTPDFIVRNLMRDFLTAFVNSKGLFSPVDSLKGLSSVLRKDAHWADWVKSGGANSTMVALDRAYLQESLTKLAGETGLMERSWNVVKSPLNGLRMVSELVENATRVGEYRKAVQGLSKGEMQDAAFASREVTLDFARMGAKMRSYNMITAFANAQIQGIDRMARAFGDRPVNTSLKIAGGITLPSILLWWANRDDKRVQDLPHWQKDLFWIIPTDKWEAISPADAASKPEHLIRQRNGQTEFNNGSIWRIPKPFELGVVFGSGAERVLDATFGNDKNAYDDFTKSVVKAFSPNYLPTFLQPLVEQFANRSTFVDRTLIPADMEKHLPEYQYTPYTTQLSRKLGQVVAAFPGMREASVDPGNPAGPVSRALSSPILIENYIRSWTGGLGMYALEAADTALRKTGVLPDPIKPTPTVADIPFVKAFAVRYPSASAQPIQDFYDRHEQDKKFFDTWMARAKEGDAEAMQRIQDAGGPQMFMRLDAIKETLSEHNKLIRDIYKNPKMPAEEKRQLIDGLYYAMIEIGRAGRDIQRQIRTGEQDLLRITVTPKP